MNNTVDNNAIMAGIELGYDVEAFTESKLGKFILDRARDEALEAMNSLKTIDCTEKYQIAKLQNIIHRAESFEGWLIEAYQQGKAMESQLELAQAED